MKFSLKVGNIIHESDIDDVFQSRLYYNQNKDKKNIQEKVQTGSLIQSLIILLAFPFDGSNYVKLPIELDHSRKDLINIQNMMIMDALNGVQSDISIRTKAAKNFPNILNFKDVNFKIRDIDEIKNKNSNDISAFRYEHKNLVISNLCIKKMLRRRTY